MPYQSAAQPRFFHSPGAKRAGLTTADVAKWDRESKGTHPPARASSSTSGRSLGKHPGMAALKRRASRG